MSKPAAPKVHFQSCNFNQSDHQEAFTHLIGTYMQDPMGDTLPLSPVQKQKLLSDLAEHPSVLAFFILSDNEYAGLAVAFSNYSTFRAARYLNIHDLIIHPKHRNKNLGRLLMNHLIDYAKERHYCKITLEVRNDNHIAQSLYRSIDFAECHPPMLFWEKLL
jgi:ribosomal protein S18 acetylase RimI-like enzyme